MTDYSLNIAINNYQEKLENLEKTCCPTFCECLPLTIVEIIKGTFIFSQKMWRAFINVPIVGAFPHLLDDFIQIIFIQIKQSLNLNFLVDFWKSFLNLKPIRIIRVRQDKWQARVVNLLIARDELEKLLIDEEFGCNHIHISSGILTKVVKLDDRLRNQSDRIFRTRDLEKLQVFRKPKTAHWWWNPTPPRDRLDWLWQLSIYTCIIGAVSLGADIASRFFAGGDFLGIVAVVGPALLAILLGKEGFSQIASSLETALKKLDIPKRYWRELILVFGGFLIFIMFSASYEKSSASICYYNAARELAFSKDEIKILDTDVDKKEGSCNQPFLPIQSLPSLYWIFGTPPPPSQGIIRAESYLKTASALDPDNSRVGFALGFIYELQQDIDNARKQYKAAMRNGSKLGRIRLAKLYLRDNKEESATVAANILWQNPPETEPDLANRIAWRVVMASARLQQKRYSEAKTQVDKISNDIKSSGSIKSNSVRDIVNPIELKEDVSMIMFLKQLKLISNNKFKLDIQNPNKVVGIVDCIRIEILENEAKVLKDEAKALEEGAKTSEFGAKILESKVKKNKARLLKKSCYSATNPTDVFQDTLRGSFEKYNVEENLNDKSKPSKAER